MEAESILRSQTSSKPQKGRKDIAQKTIYTRNQSKTLTINDRKVLHAVRDLVQNLILPHAVRIVIPSEPNDHKTLLLAHDGLVHVPSCAKMGQNDGAHGCALLMMSYVMARGGDKMACLFEGRSDPANSQMEAESMQILEGWCLFLRCMLNAK